MNYDNLNEGFIYYHPSIGKIKLSDKPNLCFTCIDTNEAFLMPQSHLKDLTTN